jgi:DNA-binding PadR family transcriptional regulator
MARRRKDFVHSTLDLLVLRHGWASAEWGLRYYTFTKTGQKQLAREKQNWKSITTAFEKVLEGA